MKLLWKAVVLGVGMQSHPKKLWFAENLRKIPENPGKNDAQDLQIYTWTPFLEVTPKRGLDISGRKSVGKSCIKTFLGIWGNLGKNPSHPKNLPALTPMMKRHLHPRCPLLKGQRDKCPILRQPCASYSTGALFTCCCRLQLAPVMNINYQSIKDRAIHNCKNIRQSVETEE